MHEQNRLPGFRAGLRYVQAHSLDRGIAMPHAVESRQWPRQTGHSNGLHGSATNEAKPCGSPQVIAVIAVASGDDRACPSGVRVRMR